MTRPAGAPPPGAEPTGGRSGSAAPVGWRPPLLGHVVTAAAAGALAVVVVLDLVRRPATLVSAASVWVVGALVGLAAVRALAAARALVLRRTLHHRPPTTAELVTHARRIAENSFIAVFPLIYAPAYVGFARFPAPLTAALIAVLAAVFLLDLHDANRLNAAHLGTTPPQPGAVWLLPTDSHRPMRRRQPLAVALLAIVALVSIWLMAFTLATELDRPPVRPLVSTLQVLAAAATALVPVLGVLALSRLGHSLLAHPGAPDGLRLDLLHEATHRFRRLTAPATAATALTAAAVLADPASPTLAMSRAVLLLLVLFCAVQQAVAIVPLHTGNLARPRRR